MRVFGVFRFMWEVKWGWLVVGIEAGVWRRRGIEEKVRFLFLRNCYFVGEVREFYDN